MKSTPVLVHGAPPRRAALRCLVALSACIVLALAGCGPAAREPAGPAFMVGFPDSLGSGPLEGRLFVILSREGDPLWGPYPDAPFYVTDVTGWRPGESVRVDAGTPGFPCPLDSIPRGGYFVRAIVDTNSHHWSSTWAPGNLFSEKTEILAGADTVLSLTLARQVQPPVFEETDRIHEVVLPSRLVSDFAGAPRRLACAVVLPPSYGVASERRYPAVYVIPGWGATRHAVLRGDHQRRRYGMEGFGEEKIFVFLDHEVAEGFHCFADSDNLGPWGTALVRELIPHLESRYRLIPDPDARFLTGQSSGGWGALYLQIVFPETFGGAWAASPDFVDFRSFGPGLDIYRPGANLYCDEAGCPRPAWRDAARHTVLLTRRQAVQMELLTGPGGQMQAFEAVYGMREDDGRPARLFDRETGVIDPRVAASWSRYDLCRLLRRHWRELAPRLAGRVHVVAARDDPFYLDEPVSLLAAMLDSLGADADIRLLPAGGHDVWSDEIRTWMHDGMGRLRAANR